MKRTMEVSPLLSWEDLFLRTTATVEVFYLEIRFPVCPVSRTMETLVL